MSLLHPSFNSVSRLRVLSATSSDQPPDENPGERPSCSSSGSSSGSSRGGPAKGVKTTIRTRYSKAGAALPKVGLVLDAPFSLDVLTDVAHREANVAGRLVAVSDGLLDDRWHVIAVVRTEDAREPGQSQRVTDVREERNPVIAALHAFGVRQVVSCAFGEFDPDALADSLGIRTPAGLQFLDLSDAPELGASLESTSCPRLRVSALQALQVHDVLLLPDHLATALHTVAANEKDEAKANGMCFAAIEMLTPLTNEQRAHAQGVAVKAMLGLFDVISPLASCRCARRIDEDE